MPPSHRRAHPCCSTATNTPFGPESPSLHRGIITVIVIVIYSLPVTVPLINHPTSASYDAASACHEEGRVKAVGGTVVLPAAQSSLLPGHSDSTAFVAIERRITLLCVYARDRRLPKYPGSVSTTLKRFSSPTATRPGPSALTHKTPRASIRGQINNLASRLTLVRALSISRFGIGSRARIKAGAASLHCSEV